METLNEIFYFLLVLEGFVVLLLIVLPKKSSDDPVVRPEVARRWIGRLCAVATVLAFMMSVNLGIGMGVGAIPLSTVILGCVSFGIVPILTAWKYQQLVRETEG